MVPTQDTNEMATVRHQRDDGADDTNEMAMVATGRHRHDCTVPTRRHRLPTRLTVPTRRHRLPTRLHGADAATLPWPDEQTAKAEDPSSPAAAGPAPSVREVVTKSPL